MNNLIDRQKAIDALNKRIEQIGYDTDVLVLSLRQAIQDLPSEEPEAIRCEDCIHGEHPKDYFKPLLHCKLDKTPLYYTGSDFSCIYAKRREK